MMFEATMELRNSWVNFWLAMTMVPNKSGAFLRSPATSSTVRGLTGTPRQGNTKTPTKTAYPKQAAFLKRLLLVLPVAHESCTGSKGKQTLSVMN